jgi:uncharacterized protein YjbI with pentapeptide repeats
LTAQRILAAHLRPGAVDTFWPDIDLDLTEAQLHQLDLSNCRIRKAQFGGTEFSGYTRFDEAEFAEGAKFDGARARPVEDRIHVWPATWSTRDACEGEEAGWLYLVRLEE